MIVQGQEVYNSALEILKKPDVTFQELEKVFNDFNLLLDTSFAENDEHISTMWFHLGSTSNKRGHRVLALLCFQEALKTRPNFLEAINNIGYLYKKMDFAEEARANFAKVIDLIESGKEEFLTTDENKAEFYTNFGSMFVSNGTPDDAIAYFDKSEQLHPVRLNHYNRGLAYLEKGDYENGFNGYEYGDRIDHIKNRNYGYENLPIWDGTPGKKVVVIGEQGIGDELMFGTIIPDLLKDCNAVIDAHPRLADMFRRSFPDLDVYGTRKDAHYLWGKKYKLDAKVLMGSLAHFYRKKRNDFPGTPYLVPNKKYVDKYEMKLSMMGSKPKIGISWRGGTKHTNRNHRFIELEQWLDILRLDCDFISLQYDSGISDKIKEFEAKHEVKIHHWPEMLEDYEQTAGLVKNLDLIISVPQSVVHLAGVLGVWTWQLCPYKSLWQAGVHSENMPWYSCVSNFWQGSDCDWQPVMNRVKDELCNLLLMNTEN